jgi:hypothetical protein
LNIVIFNHGYAATSHSSQGLTVERVLVHADTRVHPALLNSRFGYVSISRTSHEATLFTDDMAKLGPQLGADVSKDLSSGNQSRLPGWPKNGHRYLTVSAIVTGTSRDEERLNVTENYNAYWRRRTAQSRGLCPARNVISIMTAAFTDSTARACLQRSSAQNVVATS